MQSVGAVSNLVCRCVKPAHAALKAGIGMAGKQAAVAAEIHCGLGAVAAAPPPDSLHQSPPGPDPLQERLAEWEKSVDASGLTAAEVEVHRAHLKAVKVSAWAPMAFTTQGFMFKPRSHERLQPNLMNILGLLLCYSLWFYYVRMKSTLL